VCEANIGWTVCSSGLTGSLPPQQTQKLVRSNPQDVDANISYISSFAVFLGTFFIGYSQTYIDAHPNLKTHTIMSVFRVNDYVISTNVTPAVFGTVTKVTAKLVSFKMTCGKESRKMKTNLRKVDILPTGMTSQAASASNSRADSDHNATKQVKAVFPDGLPAMIRPTKESVIAELRTIVGLKNASMSFLLLGTRPTLQRCC
jgi:hypothetical protein